MNITEVFVDIYTNVLKQGKVLMCERDYTYNPTVYKISICDPEIDSIRYNNIVLSNDGEDIKRYIIKTYTLQPGKLPFCSYRRGCTFTALETISKNLNMRKP
jgi:hypothetical protein